MMEVLSEPCQLRTAALLAAFVDRVIHVEIERHEVDQPKVHREVARCAARPGAVNARTVVVAGRQEASERRVGRGGGSSRPRVIPRGAISDDGALPSGLRG